MLFRLQVSVSKGSASGSVAILNDADVLDFGFEDLALEPFTLLFKLGLMQILICWLANVFDFIDPLLPPGFDANPFMLALLTEMFPNAFRDPCRVFFAACCFLCRHFTIASNLAEPSVRLSPSSG